MTDEANPSIKRLMARSTDMVHVDTQNDTAYMQFEGNTPSCMSKLCLTSGAYTKKPWNTPKERPRTMKMKTNIKVLSKADIEHYITDDNSYLVTCK